MTTNIEIVASHVSGLADEAYSYMSDLVNKINRFDPKSEVSCINLSSRNQWHPISRLIYDLLSVSECMRVKTKGMFRVDFEGLCKTPQGKHGYQLKSNSNGHFAKLNCDTFLNFGGIGKGFIVDKVFSFLETHDAKNIMVNAGGDLRAKSIEQPWRVGLTNPYKQKTCFGSLLIKDSAIVSSGDYARSYNNGKQRKTHFFDPKTKSHMTKTPYSQVTIKGDSTAESEVYAKCMLMGLDIEDQLEGIGVDSKTKMVRPFGLQWRNSL